MTVLNSTTDKWATATGTGLKALLMISIAGVLLIALVPERGSIGAEKVIAQSTPVLVSGSTPLTAKYASARDVQHRRLLDHPSTLFTEGEPLASELIRRVLNQPVATAPKPSSGRVHAAAEAQS